MPQAYCSPEELRNLADALEKGEVDKVTARVVASAVPPETFNAVVTEIRKKTGWLGFVRTMRGAFGPEFTARVLTPLMITLNKYETFRSNAFKSYMEALEPMGVKGWRKLIGPTSKQDQAMLDAVLNLDDAGRYVGPPTMVDTGTLEAAKNVRAQMESIGREHGVRVGKYLEYRKAIMANSNRGPVLYDSTPFSQAFKRSISPEEGKFFSELERRGIPRQWDPRMSSVYQDFINAVGSKRILTPAINDLEALEVTPFFNAKYYRKTDGTLGQYGDGPGIQMWQDLKDHVYGQPTDLDRKLTIAYRQLADMVGMERRPEVRDIYQIVQAVSHLFYAGVLATPGAAVRQMFQLVPSFAELGVRPFVAGWGRLFEPGYAKELIRRGILLPPLEAIHEQVGLARGAGRIIQQGTETALKMFDMADRTARIITAGGAEFKFQAALSRSRDLSSLQAGREIKERLVKLVSAGKDEEARDLYMMDMVAQTQGAYGRLNRPQIFRGAIGQAVGILQTYPMNTFEMYNYMGKRAIRALRGEDPWTEALPMIRQLALVGGIVLGGKEAFSTDLSSNFLSFPGNFPIAGTASAALSAGRTNFEWVWGNMFQLGETDYHKRLRSEADREFMREAANFIPGGLAYKQYMKVADQPTFDQIMRLMGFPPLAEEINIEVRDKAATTRREKRLTDSFSQ